MIDPQNPIRYNATINELQEFLLFCIVVAGKNSTVQAKKLENFLVFAHNSYTAHHHHRAISHFEVLRWLGEKGIEKWLQMAKMGQYKRISVAFRGAANLCVDECTLEDLIAVKGIGPKTARFFLLFTRKDCKYAVLDTHILKFLRKIHVQDVPLATPQKKSDYDRLEKEFTDAWEIAGNGLTLAEFDLTIWKYYNESLQTV